MKWGDSKTLKFIKLYEMHPCLWDTTSSHYNIRSKRDEALDAILAKMNIPNFTHPVCKMKIKNIRSQYCHELKKIRLSMRDGGKVHRPTLSWFDAIDKFLRPVVVQRSHRPFSEAAAPADQSDLVELEFVDSKKIVEDVSDEGTILKSEELDISDVESEILYEEETTEPSAPSRQNMDASISNSLLSNQIEVDTENRRKENESIKLLTAAVKKLENTVMRNTAIPSGNEFDVFGQSVAAQLNSMPIGDALLLQMEIQQLISTKRISRLSSTKDGRR